MNVKKLNRNQLKYIVIIAMLIDHIAGAFVPIDTVLAQIMHFIGRLTGPTMAYFLAEGYVHTRNVKKYVLRLGLFGLISWIPFSLFECGHLPIYIMEGRGGTSMNMLQIFMSEKNQTLCIFPCMGVLFTLFLSLLAIWLWDKGHCPRVIKVLGVIGLVLLSCFGDWPFIDVLYALTLFIYRDNEKRKWISFSIITVFAIVLYNGLSAAGIFHFGIFMVPLLIHFCYNGEKGSRKPIHKWFFYVFYPVHLILLAALKLMI